MDSLFDTLLDAVPGKLGSAASALVPEDWKRRARARLRDENPLARIALNHDLLRAVRLAWVEAALDVVEEAARLAQHADFASQQADIRTFAGLATTTLRRVRDEAMQTDRAPGSCPIDDHARAVIEGVAETVTPGAPGPHGTRIGASFPATLAALTGWEAAEVPRVFTRVATAGLASEGGPPRAFGDLVLADFADLLKSPKRYPEAREAFHIAMGQACLDAVRGLDAKVDAALTGLDAVALAREGLDRYFSQLTEIAGGVARTEARAERIEAKVDELLASGRGRAVAAGAQQDGVSGDTLRAVMLRLWAQGLGRDDLIAELEHWLGNYLDERARGVNEDEAFRRALAEAQRRFDAGRIDEASAALMDEFAREAAAEAERQEERKRRRLRLLEEAVRFDEMALNGEAAADKLHRMVVIEEGDNTKTLGVRLVALASEYYKRGEKKGDNAPLLVSIATYRTVLREYGQDQSLLEWANIKNELGNALARLGERESGTALLEEAVGAFHAALGVRTRAHVPSGWAATLQNLGAALTRLGEREGNTARLEEAVRSFRSVLEERTRKHAPLEWAKTQTNLGTALFRLGERDSNNARLEEAVVAFRAALEVFTFENTPLEWAKAERSLGTALWRLGERDSSNERLEEAVATLRAALQECIAEHAPLEWAGTQNNLGSALFMLSLRERDNTRLEEAIVAFRKALEHGGRARVPLQWAMTQNNLGNALSRLGQRRDDIAQLEQAVSAYRAALEEWTKDRVPLNWAGAQSNLGIVLTTLGAREGSTARLKEAVEACFASLGEWTRDRVPLQWASTQSHLGYALYTLGEMEGGTAQLESAVSAYGCAMQEYTRERFPKEWARNFGNQGLILGLIAERKSSATLAQAAIQQIEASLEVFGDFKELINIDFYQKEVNRLREVIKHMT